MHAHCGSSLSLRSTHRHTHVSCARWVISSTSPFTSSPISSSLLSSCSSCCLTLSTSLNVVDSKPAHFRWGAGRPSQKELLHSMRKENLGETDDSESEPWYYKLVPRNNEDCGKPLVGEAAESFSSDFQESQRESEATWNNFFSYRHPQVSLRMRYFLWCGISLGNIMMKAWVISMCSWPCGECSRKLLFKH